MATSLLFVAQAEIAGSAVSADRAEAQALVRSGLVAVMALLDEQRPEILDGRTPRIDEEFVIYETAGRIGVVRLLAVGPGGELLVPEAGRLDLQSADADALAATGMIDDVLARAIVAHRDGTLNRPYQSVGELLDVPGMSAETLYGPIDEPRDIPDADGSPRGLADVVTVYGFEPALQQDGTLRINLNVPWSDELAERVTERFGSGASETLQRIVAGGTAFDSDAKIFEVLNFFQMQPSDWPEIIDTFTTDDSEMHYGRLDINTASYEALLGLPGIEPEQATEIVQMRDDLADDERATIAWPAIHGIIDAGLYEQIGGLITTRSWTWRLRLAAGEINALDADAPLTDAVVYEVVVDLSAPRTRLAYIREITWLRSTALIAADATGRDAEAGFEDAERPDVPTDPDDLPFSRDPEISGQPRPDEAVPPLEADPDPTAAPSQRAAPPARQAGRRIGRWRAG